MSALYVRIRHSTLLVRRLLHHSQTNAKKLNYAIISKNYGLFSFICKF